MSRIEVKKKQANLPNFGNTTFHPPGKEKKRKESTVIFVNSGEKWKVVGK